MARLRGTQTKDRCDDSARRQDACSTNRVPVYRVTHSTNAAMTFVVSVVFKFVFFSNTVIQKIFVVALEPKLEVLQ